MKRFFGAAGTAAWTGGFAVVLTAATGAIWSALLLTNLEFGAGVPWAAGVMAVFSLALWRWLGRGKRADYLRAARLPAGIFVLAVAAGGACLAGLAGLWIVLFELVKVPGNVSDVSRLPPLTVFASLAMAAIVGAVFEEAGFRGYFQGTLERTLPAPAAIAICAALMAPEHAATQGFVWPTMLFYLLVDAMLGASAALTKSILPGIVVHAAGLFTFFAVIWPADRARHLVWEHGADAWFWLHLAQAAVFGAIGIALFVRLARQTREI
jgi:membrane protease YdiL (CAAX protease family)